MLTITDSKKAYTFPFRYLKFKEPEVIETDDIESLKTIIDYLITKEITLPDNLDQTLKLARLAHKYY